VRESGLRDSVARSRNQSYRVVAADENTVLVTYITSRNGGYSFTGNDDADEVQWIGSGDRDGEV
jgi:hypothetical protein